MRKTRILLWVQAALCVLLVVLLSLAALDICVTGAARVAADPAASIYTVEEIRAHAGPALAVFAAALMVSAVCAALGVRGEEGRTTVEAGRPVSPGKDRKVLRRVLIAAAVLLILAGVANGSMSDVLGKAARICTECVGLG